MGAHWPQLVRQHGWSLPNSQRTNKKRAHFICGLNFQVARCFRIECVPKRKVLNIVTTPYLLVSTSRNNRSVHTPELSSFFTTRIGSAIPCRFLPKPFPSCHPIFFINSSGRKEDIDIRKKPTAGTSYSFLLVLQFPKHVSTNVRNWFTKFCTIVIPASSLVCRENESI